MPESSRTEALIEYRYEFRDGPYDLIVALSGPASVEEILRGRAELLADPRLRPRLNVLYDLTGLDAGGLTHEDVHSLAGGARRIERAQARAVAVAAPRPLVYGLARMLQSYVGDVRLAEHFTIVDSVAEAYEWLASLDRSGGG